MGLNLFRVRSPARDRETDASRLRRLRKVLSDVGAEMERERNGLRDRYEKVSANAAFSLLAVEEENNDAGMGSRIGDMTETIIHYANRLASLDSQIHFLSNLDHEVMRFVESVEPHRRA